MFVDKAANVFLAFIVHFFWEGRLPHDNPYEWKHTEQSQVTSGKVTYTVNRFESTAALDACRQHPEHWIQVPSVSNTIHRVEMDGYLLYASGDPDEQMFYDFAGSSIIKCSQVLNGRKLTWMLYDFSNFYRVQYYPRVVESVPKIKVFQRTIRPCAAFALILLAFFLFTHFWGKLSSHLVISLSLAALLLGINFALEEASSFCIQLNILERMRWLFIATFLGQGLLTYAMYIKDYVGRGPTIFHCGACIFSSVLCLFGGHPDTMQFIEMAFMNIPNWFIGLAIIYRTGVLLASGRGGVTVLHVLTVAFFVLGAAWDNGYYMGLHEGPIILPMAMVCGFMFFSLAINEDVTKTYREKERLEKEANELQRRNAVAEGIRRTSLVLAHDVRKPFTLLESLLVMLSGKWRSSSATLSNDDLQRYLGEIRNAVGSVNDLVRDTLDMGTEIKNIVMTEESPTKLIMEGLSLAFREPCQSKIDLRYVIETSKLAQVDREKIKRVIVNIVANAADAVVLDAVIRFRVQETEDGMCKFEIFNTGSYIAADKRQLIFENFYSDGKKMGRGLGLSICKKIVSEHDGHIWCESERGVGTTFSFTVPIGTKSDPFLSTEHPQLPRSNEEIAKKWMESKEQNAMDQDRRLPVLIREVVERCQQHHRTFQVLIIDDEQVYCDMIAGYIESEEELRRSVKLEARYDIKDLNIEKLMHFDLIIVDVDLRSKDLTGFDIVQRLRDAGFPRKICIHSNRGVFEYAQESARVGSDIFLPKPMTNYHLFRLICNALVDQGAATVPSNPARQEASWQTPEHLS